MQIIDGKTIGRLTGALLVSVALLGADLAAAQDTTLKVWFGRKDFIPDGALTGFMAENPSIKVVHEVIRLEDASAQLILGLRSGNAPDVVQIYERDALTLAAGGALKDFTDQVKAMKVAYPKTFAQLAPITWDAVTDASGKIYGMSLFNMSVYMTYRIDWLAEAGVKLPLDTTDKVLDAARRIKALKGPGSGYSLVGCCGSPTWELPLFRSFGGQYKNSVPQIDNEIGVAWIDFYQTLMREGLASSDTPAWDSGQMRAAFIGGRAGFMNEGEHIFVEMHKQHPYQKGTWGFAPLPVRPGQTEPQVQTGFGFPYVVTAANRNAEATMKLMAYLAREDVARSVSIRYQPVSNTVVANHPAYLAAKPWAQNIAPLSARIVPLPSHPTRGIQVSNVLIQLRDHMVANPTADAARVAKEFQAKLNAAAASR